LLDFTGTEEGPDLNSGLDLDSELGAHKRIWDLICFPAFIPRTLEVMVSCRIMMHLTDMTSHAKITLDALSRVRSHIILYRAALWTPASCPASGMSLPHCTYIHSTLINLMVIVMHNYHELDYLLDLLPLTP